MARDNAAVASSQRASSITSAFTCAAKGTATCHQEPGRAGDRVEWLLQTPNKQACTASFRAVPGRKPATRQAGPQPQQPRLYRFPSSIQMCYLDLQLGGPCLLRQQRPPHVCRIPLRQPPAAAASTAVAATAGTADSFAARGGSATAAAAILVSGRPGSRLRQQVLEALRVREASFGARLPGRRRCMSLRQRLRQWGVGDNWRAYHLFDHRDGTSFSLGTRASQASEARPPAPALEEEKGD